MDLRLEEKAIVVTGGTAGIGRAIAAALCEEGARVVTASRSSDGPGVGEVAHVAADLFEQAGPGAMIESAVAHLGRLEGLVNNVGFAKIRRLDEVTDDDWLFMFQANVMSAIRATCAAVPHLIAGGRRLGREHRVDRRTEAVAQDARLLGREGRDARVLAPGRRDLRGRRDPLQRGDPWPDADRRLAR